VSFINVPTAKHASYQVFDELLLELWLAIYMSHLRLLFLNLKIFTLNSVRCSIVGTVTRLCAKRPTIPGPIVGKGQDLSKFPRLFLPALDPISVMGVRGLPSRRSRCSIVNLTSHLHTAPRSKWVKLCAHYLNMPYSRDEGQFYLTFNLLKTKSICVI